MDALPHALRSGEELVLSRWHMQRPKLTVSREQCKVMVAADGTADLVSCGKGPTLLRQSGAPWYAVSRSDTCPLAHGDQISLDCNDPEAAVFTCEVSSTYYGYTCYGHTTMAILTIAKLAVAILTITILGLQSAHMMSGEQRCAANLHAAVLRAKLRAQLRAKLRAAGLYAAGLCAAGLRPG